MIDLFIATAEQEPSKTPYYLAGVALALWAIGLSVVGFTSPDFPRTATQSRAIMVVGVMLTVFVMAAVVLTS